MLESSDEILTLKEVQKLLKIGKNKALDLVNSGELNAFRIGCSWRIRKADVIRLILRK